MEPFKITCVSCRAVLTVRKESMIGQIIACPRCSMMVQVMPPAGYVAAAKAPTSDSTPAAASLAAAPVAKQRPAAAAIAPAINNFDAPDAGTEFPPPASARVESALTATFDDAVDAIGDAPAHPATLRLTPSATLANSGTESAFAEPIDAATQPVPSLAARPTKSLWVACKFPVMIVGGAVAGAAIVATALTLLSGDPVPDVAAKSAEPTAAPSPPTAATLPTAVAEPAQGAPVPTSLAASGAERSQAAATEVPENAAAPVGVPLVESPAVASAEVEPKGDAPADANGGDVAVAPDSPAEAAATPPAADAVAGQPAVVDQPKLRIDPLEIDPEGLNLSTLYSGPPQDPLAASSLPGEEQGVELSVPDAQEAPPDATPPVDEPSAVAAVRRDEQAVGAPGNNVATLLARKTRELKVSNMPLCRLLDLSVQLSGLPISVAPEQLRLAAVSAGQPATADVKDATIEAFLAAALKPLRLEPVVVNDQIVLIHGGNNPRRTVTYSVDDLAGDPAAVEQLVDTIQKVVAPESWQAAGGAGKIAIDGNQLKIETGEATQYDILLLLERSRAALGLAPRSKYPAALIGGEAAPVALAARVGAPATFTFSQYTPLREIFRHWQEDMQVAVLVDWPVLADLRLWPNTRIACSSSGKPWDAALDEVLVPLGLAWRPIDKRTIEITSQEKAASAPLVEIYRLSSEALAGDSSLTAEIERIAAAAGAPADASRATVVDAVHGLLIVRQPATVQRAIAAWLAEKQLLATTNLASR